METRIQYDINTGTKKIWALQKHKHSKLTSENQDLMNRQMNSENPDYAELNKTKKKEIRKDLRTYNPEQTKQIIANNKNMIIIKSNKTNGRIRIISYKTLKIES